MVCDALAPISFCSFCLNCVDIFISPDRQKCYFSYSAILAFVMGAQNNRLIETVLLSTYNKCFG